jgi:hypothetical protein
VEKVAQGDGGYSIAELAIVEINEIAMLAHAALFWYTPYHTGNLAQNGIDAVGALGMELGAGFGVVGKSTDYGQILQEAKVINYKITDRQTGHVYTESYENKHYNWLGKAADGIAAQIPAWNKNVRLMI